MASSNNLTSQIVESLSTISSTQQTRVLHHMIARPIKTLSIYKILEIRCAIVANLDTRIPAVAAALNILDGQIILREIAGGEPWR